MFIADEPFRDDASSVVLPKCAPSSISFVIPYNGEDLGRLDIACKCLISIRCIASFAPSF